MNAGLPDDAPPPSLVGRVAAFRPGRVEMTGGARVALALAALLAAGPLLTLVGARIGEARARAEIATLMMRAADREDGRRDRAELAAALRSGIGTTIERLAAVLPPDATLQGVERDAAGRLRIAVATPDPDRLRSVLRRDPALRALRDAGQSGGEGAIVVVLEGASS